jgi:hypothetical protein
LGVHITLPAKFSLSAAATLGRTGSDGGEDRSIRADGDLISTAFGIAAAKTGILGKRDMLRLSLSQPLTVQKGDMLFTSVQVVNRETGELGEVIQRFSIADRTRRFSSEFVYATPLLSAGEIGLFGRADYVFDKNTANHFDGLVIGGRVSMPF